MVDGTDQVAYHYTPGDTTYLANFMPASTTVNKNLKSNFSTLTVQKNVRGTSLFF